MDTKRYSKTRFEDIRTNITFLLLILSCCVYNDHDYNHGYGTEERLIKLGVQITNNMTCVTFTFLLTNRAALCYPLAQAVSP